MRQRKKGILCCIKGRSKIQFNPFNFIVYGMKKFSNRIKEATIPVENIRCPILILSGNDDKQWPSPISGKSIIERLDAMGSKIKRKYVELSRSW